MIMSYPELVRLKKCTLSLTDTFLVFAFRPLVSGFSLSVFQLFVSFHPQPVEQCALGLLLAGGEFD